MSILPRASDTTIPCPVCKVSLRRIPLGTGWIDDGESLIEQIVIQVEPHRCQKLEKLKRERRRR